MLIIVSFIFIISGIQLLTVVLNWLFSHELRDEQTIDRPLISVLIPARNEEKNIHQLLVDLQHQTYENIELLVFDDHSSDRTAHLVLELAQTDKKIRLIETKPLPGGWLGKNWACYNLAQAAKGTFYLFLDADVNVNADLIQKTVAFANKRQLGLLSIFPKQIMQTAGEKLTVPLMHFILLTLLPLFLVRISKFKAHAAANGQFMLFRAATYQKYQPHQYFRNEKVEDIQIARFFKSQKIAIACLTETEIITCRMYRNYREACDGFSRNIHMFFGNSTILTLLFWFITTFGWLFVALYSIRLFVLYLIMVILIRILVSLTAKQNVWDNIILHLPQQLAMAGIIVKSLKKEKHWKGRSI